MLKPNKDGVALLTTLQKVEEITHKAPPELEEYYNLDYPFEFSTYWHDFIEIGRKRGQIEGGFLPITFVDIDAWCRVTGTNVSQLWLDIIELLDRTWLDVQRSK